MLCGTRVSIAVIFCLPMQNFTETGQSAVALWPKQFSIWQPAAILNFKIIIFGQVIVTDFQIYYQISSKSDGYLLRYDIYIYANAAYAVMRCPSVCPSVTFVNSVKASNRTFKIVSPSDSHTILVFPYQTP